MKIHRVNGCLKGSRSAHSRLMRKVGNLPEVRLKNSLSKRRKWSEKDYRDWRILNHPFRGKHHSEYTRRLISRRVTELWKNPDIAEKFLHFRDYRPSKPEKLLLHLLDRWFRGKWKYVGDGSFWIHYKGKNFNPDFVDCNGQKLFIEFMGFYLHTRAEENVRKLAFNSLGYRTLFLHYDDLENIESLRMKIGGFVNEEV